MLKLLNLLALLLAIAWLARNPDWEPAITSIGLLAALLSQEVIPIIKGSQSSNHDKELFDKFLKVLPSNGRTINFLKSHNMGDPFPKENLDELDMFLDTWDNAEHEFQNKKLENQRKSLFNLAQEFNNELSVNVYPKGLRLLSMEIRDFEDRPEILEKMTALNKSAQEVYKAHQELVRMGKRYLKKI